MKNLEKLKTIFLSERISNDEKHNIVHKYFNSKLNILTEDQEKRINEIANDALGPEYLKLFGKNWREIIIKYKIKGSKYNLIYEESPYENLGWQELKEVCFSTSEEYPPIIKNDKIWNPFSNNKEKENELISVLFEILEIKYSIYQELLSRQLIIDRTKCGYWEFSRYIFLPNIITFQNLREKFPDVFDFYIQSLLLNYDQIKIVEIEEEVENLRNKLC